LGDADERKQIKKMFEYTDFELIVLSLIEGFISLYMGSVLVLIAGMTHDEDVNADNFGYDPLSTAVCFSSLFFASCIRHFFSAYKMHADELQVNQFISCF